MSDLSIGDVLPDALPTEAVQEFVQDYEWLHTILGIVGNLTFFVGSVFFLSESLQRAGVWLFIVGSFGMMIGSIGRIIVNRARRAKARKREERTARRLAELTAD